MKKFSDKVVTIDIARKLREIGFNEPCLVAFDGSDMLSTHSKNVFDLKNYNKPGGTYKSAPLYQDVVEFFDLNGITIDVHFNSNLNSTYQYQIHTTESFCVVDSVDEFPTRREALKQAILDAVKIYKKEKQ